MSILFHGRIVARDEVHDLPGIWSDGELRSLLERLGIEEATELASADLPEMVAMALQDLEPEEAANVVLECVFGEKMKPGVRNNLVPDLMEEDAPWEEFSDVVAQRGIFVAMVLLQRAFPRVFARPDIMRLELLLKPANQEATDDLESGPSPSLTARLTADAVGAQGLLHRLYGDEVSGKKRFVAAPALVWQAELSKAADSEFTLVVHAPAQWVRGGADSGAFESSAMGDELLEEGV